MTTLVQLLLFLSSYSPLFCVFALLDTFGRGWPTIACVALAALGVVLLPVLFLVDRDTAARPLRIQSLSSRDSDVLAYIASYLVPFASFVTASNRQRAAVILFVVLIAVLYVRLQLFYVNPLLALGGYRVYQIATEGGNSAILLTRRRFIAPYSAVRAVRMSDYVWREKR